MPDAKFRIVEMTVAQLGDKFTRRLHPADKLVYVVEETAVVGLFKKKTVWRRVDHFYSEHSAYDAILRYKGIHPEQTRVEEALNYPKNVIWEEE